MFLTNKNKNRALKTLKETVHSILHTTILKFMERFCFNLKSMKRSRQKFHCLRLKMLLQQRWRLPVLHTLRCPNPMHLLSPATPASLCCSSSVRLPRHLTDYQTDVLQRKCRDVLLPWFLVSRLDSPLC